MEKQPCKDCRQEKPFDQFFRSNSKTGYMAVCRDCCLAKKQETARLSAIRAKELEEKREREKRERQAYLEQFTHCSRCFRHSGMVEDATFTLARIGDTSLFSCSSCANRFYTCRVCGSISRPYEDSRFLFPHSTITKHLCDRCKGEYYEKHKRAIQTSYQLWVSENAAPICYVYGLIDIRDGCIHYIGRTKTLERRMLAHAKTKPDDTTQRGLWLNSLRREGLAFLYTVLSICDPGYYGPEMEARWIAHGLKTGLPLTNKEFYDYHNGRYGSITHKQIDYFTIPSDDLPCGDRETIRWVERYISWAQNIPDTLPPVYGFPDTQT